MFTRKLWVLSIIGKYCLGNKKSFYIPLIKSYNLFLTLYFTEVNLNNGIYNCRGIIYHSHFNVDFTDFDKFFVLVFRNFNNNDVLQVSSLRF